MAAVDSRRLCHAADVFIGYLPIGGIYQIDLILIEFDPYFHRAWPCKMSREGRVGDDAFRPPPFLSGCSRFWLPGEAHKLPPTHYALKRYAILVGSASFFGQAALREKFTKG